MSRIALPQNYIKSEGTLVEGFEDISEWTPTSSVTLSTDTVNYKTGSQSILLTNGDITKTGRMDKTINQSFSLQNLRIQVYVPTANDRDSSQYLYLFFATTSGFSKYMQMAWAVGKNLVVGWNTLVCHRSQFSATGGATWNDTYTVMRISVAPDETNGSVPFTLGFDDLRMNFEGMSRLALTFDDGFISQYTEAFSYMDSKGIPGTLYAAKNYITAGTVGAETYLTTENMAEMEEAGWTMANHTASHLDLTALSASQMESELIDCANWLKSIGFIRGWRHVAYPYGTWNDVLLGVMQDGGFVTGRTLLYNELFPPLAHYRQAATRLIMYNVTLATAKGWVDYIIKTGTSVIVTFHKLVESDPTQSAWTIANFQALIDYIVERKVACVTIDEWYKGLSNPRYRSVPLNRSGV